MRSLEEVFVREFKENVHMLGSKDIYSIPLPDVCDRWEVSGTEEYKVEDIEDEYYGLLNDSIVRRLPKSTIPKRREIDKVKRSYKKDENGNYVFLDYTVPSGSAVVLSPKNISLPYTRYKKDVQGFGYVDFTKDKLGRSLFMYAIPKDYLYRVNQTALALSVKSMKNYQGIGYTTWESGIIFLHVIPYNPNASYVGTKILKTGRSTDYNDEIHLISKYWEEMGIIPNIDMCALESGENLVLKPTVTGYEAYEPFDLSPVGARDIYGDWGDNGSSGDGEQ